MTTGLKITMETPLSVNTVGKTQFRHGYHHIMDWGVLYWTKRGKKKISSVNWRVEWWLPRTRKVEELGAIGQADRI